METYFNTRYESLEENLSSSGWLSIAHDLRNPLGTILAGAEVLMDLNSTSTNVARLAGNIHRAASRMRELLKDLTSLSRVHRTDTEMCDVVAVIVTAAAAAADGHESQAFHIAFDLPANLEIPLQRSRVERVFFNIISNSLEAMPQGGRIKIGARKAGDDLLVEIEDTGPGIPPAIRARLFEPYVTAGKTDGLGLGLALSRQTVLDHGGDMWAEPAAGARFVIRLPLARPLFEFC